MIFIQKHQSNYITHKLNSSNEYIDYNPLIGTETKELYSALSRLIDKIDGLVLDDVIKLMMVNEIWTKCFLMFSHMSDPIAVKPFTILYICEAKKKLLENDFESISGNEHSNILDRFYAWNIYWKSTLTS